MDTLYFTSPNSPHPKTMQTDFPLAHICVGEMINEIGKYPYLNSFLIAFGDKSMYLMQQFQKFTNIYKDEDIYNEHAKGMFRKMIPNLTDADFERIDMFRKAEVVSKKYFEFTFAKEEKKIEQQIKELREKVMDEKL